MFHLNTKDNLRMFDSKSDDEILLGYSKTSKAYRVYNSRTLVVEEGIHVKFNDTKHDKDLSEEIRLEDGISREILANHNIEVVAFNPPLDNFQGEVIEPHLTKHKEEPSRESNHR